MPDALYNEAAKTGNILDATNNQQKENDTKGSRMGGKALAPRRLCHITTIWHSTTAFFFPQGLMKLKRGGIIGKGGESKTIASTATTKHGMPAGLG